MVSKAFIFIVALCENVCYRDFEFFMVLHFDLFSLSTLFSNLFFCRDLDQDELRRYNHWTVVCAYIEHVAEVFERSIDVELSQHLFIGNDIH